MTMMPFFPRTSRFMTFSFGHKRKLNLRLMAFRFIMFFFSAFPFLDASLIWGCFSPVQKFLRKHHGEGKYLRRSEGNFVLSVFVYISGSIDPVTLI